MQKDLWAKRFFRGCILTSALLLVGVGQSTTAKAFEQSLNPGSGFPYPWTSANRDCFQQTNGSTQNKCLSSFKYWDVPVPHKNIFPSSCPMPYSCTSTHTVNVYTSFSAGCTGTPSNAALYSYDYNGYLYSVSSAVTASYCSTAGANLSVTVPVTGNLLLEVGLNKDGTIDSVSY